jgi:hypothetical protein
MVDCRSDPCVVHGAQSVIEGRYGAALFIKPNVITMNIKLWSKLDQQQKQAMLQRALAAEAAHGRKGGRGSSKNSSKDGHIGGDELAEIGEGEGEGEDSQSGGDEEEEDLWAGFGVSVEKT